MTHICEYCGYKFDRKYNLQRHMESQHGLMMNEEETENSDEDENLEESEDENKDTADTESNDDGDDDDDDDDTDDDEENSSSDNDEKEVNIWDILKEKAISQLDEDTDIDREAILDTISDYYTTLLKLHHFTRKDKYHKKIMTTKKRLMEEEEYGATEAIDAAVKQRRFAISQAAGIDNSLNMNMFDNGD